MPVLLFALFPSFFFTNPVSGGEISYTLKPTTVLGAEIHKECRENHFPILMYHHIREYQKLPDKAAQDISVSPEEFQEQLAYLKKSGYKSITTKDIVKNTVPCHSIMITFDDGYYDIHENAFPIMSKYDYTGIIALIVARMDESDYLFGPDIRGLQHAGWEIASHTWNHAILTRIQKHRLSLEIKNSKKYLEKWFHSPIKIFVYPGGFYGPDALRNVKQANYSYAFTTHFGEAHLLGKRLELNRINIAPGTTPEKLAELLEQAKQSQ